MKATCYLCQNLLKEVVDSPWSLKRCVNCGLVQASPLPDQESVNKLYQGDYWKNYTFYSSQISAHEKYFRQKVTEIKRYHQSGKLLDIGCAVGVLLQVAKNSGFSVYGIDVASYAVKECQKKGLPAATGTIHTIEQKNHYDVVAAYEVVEHERDPLQTAITAQKLLKTGGLFVVTVPNSETLSARLMGKNWFGYKNKEHLFHFTRQSFYLLLKKAGFTNIKIMKDDSRPYLFIYYLERFNYYSVKSEILTNLIKLLKKIPLINSLTVPLNPWGNLIAYAIKE